MYLLRDDINDICAILERGGTLLYPTDTIWGIGCDATNEESIARISEIKKRQPEKSYVLLVSDLDMLKDYVKRVHPRVDTLLSLHRQPLTVIYPDPKNLPKAALSDKGQAAIRVASDPFCQKLIAKFGKPLISTSANVSGEEFPAYFGEISSEILSAVDYVVKYRQDDKTRHEPSVMAIYDRQGELEFIRE